MASPCSKRRLAPVTHLKNPYIITECYYYTVTMEVPFDRRAKHLRILLAARRAGPLRFTDVRERTGLAPPEVQRYLEELTDDGFLHARPYARRGDKALVEYELSAKAKAHLDALDAYREALRAKGSVAGDESLRALDDLYA